MTYNPANNIQDYLVFGEFGGVNPSIEDSSTFTFLTSEKMGEIFEHEITYAPGLISAEFAKYLNFFVHKLSMDDGKYSIQCVRGMSGPSLSAKSQKLILSKKSRSLIFKLSL